jgi:hypothetical protein
MPACSVDGPPKSCLQAHAAAHLAHLLGAATQVAARQAAFPRSCTQLYNEPNSLIPLARNGGDAAGEQKQARVRRDDQLRSDTCT